MAFGGVPATANVDFVDGSHSMVGANTRGDVQSIGRATSSRTCPTRVHVTHRSLAIDFWLVNSPDKDPVDDEPNLVVDSIYPARLPYTTMEKKATSKQSYVGKPYGFYGGECT